MQNIDSLSTMPSVGAEVPLRITSMANGGAAIGRVGQLVVFVEGAAPDELVMVRITQRRKNFARADLVDILKPSPHRVLPGCEYFGRCGGCQWQYMGYPSQLGAKAAILRDQIQRTLRLSDEACAGIFPAPIGMDDPWRYRNVITVEPDTERKPSFHHLHSDRRISITHCPISEPSISAALTDLSATGIEAETTIRASGEERAVAYTSRAPKTVTLRLLGHDFRVSGGAFFQVNTRPQSGGIGGSNPTMADTLAEHALRGLALTGNEAVLDLYAGVGTFAILAAPNARRVVAVEESPVAATDARFNAQNLGAANVSVHTRSAEQFLAAFNERIDAVVLDPPRAGCSPPVLAGLARLRPRRIVYVSCDPATLARDLKALTEAYAIESCQLIDLFPQTFHLESITVLQRRGGARKQ